MWISQHTGCYGNVRIEKDKQIIKFGQLFCSFQILSKLSAAWIGFRGRPCGQYVVIFEIVLKKNPSMLPLQ